MSYYAGYQWAVAPYAPTTHYHAFGTIPAGGATGTSNPCPAGYRASVCGPCIPVGKRDDPTCGAGTPTSTSGQERYAGDTADSTDASSTDSTDTSTYDSSGGGGGGGGGGAPYYDGSSTDGGGTSLTTIALGVGVVGLIGYWFFTRVS